MTRPPAAVAVAAPLIPLAVLALDDWRLRRQLRAARRDPLTGLPTRADWTARARQITTHGDSALIVLVDLDHFKAINDSRGHAAGDAVLAATAARLATWSTALHGCAGRLGGDEFTAAVRVPDTLLAHHLDALAAALHQPVVHDGLVVPVGASIGAARPAGRPLSAALRAADTAMYAGKHTGRWTLADPAAAPAASSRGRRAGRRGTHLPTPAPPTPAPPSAA